MFAGICVHVSTYTHTHIPSDKFIQVFLIHYVCDLFPFIQIILITRYCAFLWLMLVHLLPLALLSSQLHVHVTLMDSVSNVAFLFFLSCGFFNMCEENNFQLLHENSIKLTNHGLLTQNPTKIIIGHPL